MRAPNCPLFILYMSPNLKKEVNGKKRGSFKNSFQGGFVNYEKNINVGVN